MHEVGAAKLVQGIVEVYAERGSGRAQVVAMDLAAITEAAQYGSVVARIAGGSCSAEAATDWGASDWSGINYSVGCQLNWTYRA